MYQTRGLTGSLRAADGSFFSRRQRETICSSWTPAWSRTQPGHVEVATRSSASRGRMGTLGSATGLYDTSTVPKRPGWAWAGWQAPAPGGLALSQERPGLQPVDPHAAGEGLGRRRPTAVTRQAPATDGRADGDLARVTLEHRRGVDDRIALVVLREHLERRTSGCRDKERSTASDEAPGPRWACGHNWATRGKTRLPRRMKRKASWLAILPG